MPTNASFEYVKSQQEYFKARTTVEKLAALKKMLTTAPKHKSAEKLNLQLKRRLAEIKKDIEKEKKAGKGKSFAIKKEGAATVAFIGVGDSGKSRLFAQLSNSEYKENLYGIQMRMIPFQNVWIQGLDLPGFYAGFAESPQAGQVFGLIRTSDLIILVVKAESDVKVIEQEMKKANIVLGATKKQDFATTNLPYVQVRVHAEIPKRWLEELKIDIWHKIGKIRVQTKTKVGIAPKPVVLHYYSNVKALAETIHKDFLRKFKYAKVWGPSAAFPGQQVGLSHKLKDTDVVEIYLT